MEAPPLGRQSNSENPNVVRYFGDYEILEQIARGGMGVVFRARQVSLNRVVALKLLAAPELASPEFAERFRIEAEAAAQLDHPNIVPIYEIGEHEGQPYFSMKLIEGEESTTPALCPGGGEGGQRTGEGETIKKERGVLEASHVSPGQAKAGRESRGPNRAATALGRRLAGKPMDLRAATALVAKLARAVQYAHSRSILHRDIKPNNVLVDARGQPHLTDFGIAKLLERDIQLTHTSALLGTPAYMAPEQARGDTRAVTTAADIYGLGTVLYEAITGKPPFAGGTSYETIQQVLQHEPQRPSFWNPHVDRDVETICLKCLEKEPARRYASAEGLAIDLERWLRHEPISARPVGRWEQFRKWVRRHPIGFGWSAALVLSFLLGFVGVLWQWTRAEQQRIIAEAQRSDAVDARDQAQRESYYAVIALADQDIRNDNLNRARSLLLSTPPQYRHWEWGHLAYLCHQEIITMTNTAGWVRLMAFDSPGARLLTANNRGELEIRDLATGQTLLRLRERSHVNEAAFSPDGRRLARALSDDRVELLDARDGALLFTLRPAMSFAFSRDGRHIVTSSSRSAPRLWDAERGLELAFLEGGTGQQKMSFTPDDRRIVGVQRSAEHSGTLTVWDRDTQTLVARALLGPAEVQAFQADPAGRHYAIGTQEGQVKIIETLSGREIFSLQGLPGGVRRMEFGFNGTRLLVKGSDEIAWLWEVGKGAPVRALGRVRNLAVSPDGRHFATTDGGRSATIWDAQRGDPVKILRGHTTLIESLLFSPDGQLLAAIASDRSIKVWLVEPEFRGAEEEGFSFGAAFDPTGRLIATAEWDWRVRVRDAATGQLIRVLPGHMQSVMAVAFSPEMGGPAGLSPASNAAVTTVRTARLTGLRLASGAADKTAKIWDAATGEELVTLRGHTGVVSSVAFSPDGQRIATASWDHTARVWDATSGRALLVMQGHERSVYAAAFSPDGRRLATGSSDGTVRLWEASSGAEVHRFTVPKDQPCLAFSHNGKMIAAGAGRVLKLWAADSYQEIRSIEGRTRIHGLAFSPDDRRLITASSENWSEEGFPTVEVWDASQGREILRLSEETGLMKAALFSPDGRSLLAVVTRQMRLWPSFPWDTVERTNSLGLGERIGVFARSFWQQRRELLAAPPAPGLGAEASAPPPRSLWPMRAAGAPNNLIDLTEYYNGLLNANWEPVRNTELLVDDFSGLPQGVVTLGGRAFDVRGVVQLAGQAKDIRSFFPSQVSGIPVNQKCVRLSVLHGTLGEEKDGNRIGAYVLHYANGNRHELPIVYDEDVRQRVQDWTPGNAPKFASIAWQGTNRLTTANNARRLVLYQRTWDNPRPEAEIRSIDFLSLQTAAAPFLIALTLE